MRKLIFTVSSVNAVLNALVIALFAEPEIIVLYNPDGTPGVYGSRWWYLIFVMLPVLVSAVFFIKDITAKKASAEQNGQSADSDDSSSDPIDEILYGNTSHNYNMFMMIIWILAIISWVMTGIALNNIQNISVILPSIIVVMLSAVTIFITSIYNNASPNTICGIKLKWIRENKEAARRSNRISMYLGVMSGMVGVCLAAWSLIVTNNIPNCIAIAQLAIIAIILPIVLSYFIAKETTDKKSN